jgi:hypothetical protein
VTAVLGCVILPPFEGVAKGRPPKQPFPPALNSHTYRVKKTGGV